MSVALRPAREADRATHAEHVAREQGYAEAPFDDEILTRLEEGPNGGCLVAERDGAFAGYLAWSRYERGRASVMVVNDISVLPDHRRTGVGRALIGGVQEAALRWKAPATVAPVWPGNAASLATFEALGYRLERRGETTAMVDAVKSTGLAPPTPWWMIALTVALPIGLALGYTAVRLFF